jgi:hypothetical protein
MTDHDPNEAYEVVPIEPGPHGPPKGWWTVKRNGLPVRHFPGKEKAQRYATDPAYRASLVKPPKAGPTIRQNLGIFHVRPQRYASSSIEDLAEGV